MKAVLVVCLVLLASMARAQDYEFTHFNLDFTESYQVKFEHLTGSDPLTLQSFARDQDQFSTYEEFITYLKNRSGALFERPVLLHSTGSIQHASPMRPRVLLFGQGSVLSFAENPAAHVKRVEMIQFDPEQRKFSMGEIRFDGSGKVQFESNPMVCTACHGQDPRPIWAPYDVWPKAYGAQAGFTHSEQETSNYQQFVSRGDKEGIYQYLNLEKITDRFDKLKSLETFTQYISSLNLMRMMRVLSEHRVQLQPFRYALAATLTGCTEEISLVNTQRVPLQDYFPPQVYAKMVVAKEKYESDGKESRKSLLDYLRRQYQSLFPSSQPDFALTERLDFEVPILAHTRFILENVGVSWRSLTAGHGFNDYSIQVPSNLAFDLGMAYAAFAPEVFQELQPKVYRENGVVGPRFNCEDLKLKSLQALESFDQPLRPQKFMASREPSVGLAPIGRCVKCHAASPGRAPEIPFDNTMELGRWLNNPQNFAKVQSKVISGQMPRGSTLTPDQKQAVLEAFNILMEEHVPDGTETHSPL